MPQLAITADPAPTGRTASQSFGALMASIPSPLSYCLPRSSSPSNEPPPGASTSRHVPTSVSSSRIGSSSGGGRTGRGGWSSFFGGNGSDSPGSDSASARRTAEESRRLLSDEYDDSDAISLLSNIVERDGRGSAASRRRARARRRAARENNGTRWGNVSQLMACGLFGRAKGQIQHRQVTQGSAGASASGAGAGAGAGHRRTLSESSAESDGSLIAAARVESGDEDAGMLDDQAIRDLSLVAPRSDAVESSQADLGASEDQQEEAQRKRREADEQDARDKEEAAAAAAAAAEERAEAARKKELEEEAERLRKEADEEEARQKEQEARLAAEEEAAVAKARRRAERKAAKAGLLKLKQESRAAQGWRTEAEAEAAAGGFDFAEEPHAELDYPDHHYDGAGQQQYFDYDDGEDQRYQDFGRFQGRDDEVDDETFHYPRDPQEPFPQPHLRSHSAAGEYVVEEHQPGVVHHHHYYHAPPTGGNDFLSPPIPQGLPLGPSAHLVSDQFDDADEQQGTKDTAAPSEDEADIAGLSFGKRKNRRADSESASRSGGGRARRGVPGGSSSQHSGGSGSAGGFRPSSTGPIHAAAASATSSSSSSWNGIKPSYRDRPRRHERQNSRSSNSSSGLHPSPMFASAAAAEGGYVRPGLASPSASASGAGSYAVPTLPNLYEQETTMPIEGQSTLYPSEGRQQQQEAGSDPMGVGGFGLLKKKRSYRDKRSANLETASAGSNHSSAAGSNVPVGLQPRAGGGTFDSPRNPTEFGKWKEEGVPGGF